MKIVCLVFLSCLLVLEVEAQVQTSSSRIAANKLKKERFRTLSEENGYYLILHQGMRYGEFDGESLSGIQDLSIYYGLGLGYRKENLSLESGLAVFHHSSSSVYFSIWERREYLMNSDLAFLVLPFTVRYDVPTGEKENIRFGVFLNGNVSMITLKNDDSSAGSMYWQSPSGSYSLISKTKSPLFFKAGVHSKIRVFNSSFLNLELGHFFSLGANREYLVTIDGGSPQKILRRWEGLSWSVGGIFPIRVYAGKFRKKKVIV